MSILPCYQIFSHYDISVFLIYYIFNWRIIALQRRVDFCSTSAWVSHRCPCLPSLTSLPPTSLRSHPPGCHRAPFWVPWVTRHVPTAVHLAYADARLSVMLSQAGPASPSPTVSTVCSLCLRLRCCSTDGFIRAVFLSSVQSLRRVQHCATSWTAGLPVLHQLLELAPTHAHQVREDIQPSHPLLSPSPAFNLSQWQGLSNESVLRISWPNAASTSVLPMTIQDWSPLGWTGWISLQSRDSQEFSPTPQFKSIKSSVLIFLYSPTLTSIHDHWKSHRFD